MRVVLRALGVVDQRREDDDADDMTIGLRLGLVLGVMVRCRASPNPRGPYLTLLYLRGERHLQAPFSAQTIRWVHCASPQSQRLKKPPKTLVDWSSEYDDAEHQKEDKQTELVRARLERLDEDLESSSGISQEDR